MFHEYEIIIILRPDIDDAATIAGIERVESTITELEAHLLERDDWGKRRLAYPIRKHTKGHYVLLRSVASPGHILEIERRMRIDDRFIRFMTVKVDEAVDVAFRVEQAREKREAAEAEATRRAEEAAAAQSSYDAAAETKAKAEVEASA